MRFKKHIKIILVILVILIALQFISYFAFSPSRIPSIALRLTPEHVHFAKGTKFDWVLFTGCRNLTDSQKERLLFLLRKHYNTVYMDVNDLPETAFHRGPNGEVLGFNRGFSYGFSIASKGLFWVWVSHGDYEGNLAAFSGEHLYIWLFGTWIKVHDGRMLIS